MSDDPQRGNPLETAPIPTLLLRYSVPTALTLMVNFLYNIVDQIFIGRGVGISGMTATNIAFPLVILVGAVSLLLGDGCAALCQSRTRAAAAGGGGRRRRPNRDAPACERHCARGALRAARAAARLAPRHNGDGLCPVRRVSAHHLRRDPVPAAVPGRSRPSSARTARRSTPCGAWARGGTAQRRARRAVYLPARDGRRRRGHRDRHRRGRLALLFLRYLPHMKTVQVRRENLRPAAARTGRILALGLPSLLTQMMTAAVQIVMNNLMAQIRRRRPSTAATSPSRSTG